MDTSAVRLASAPPEMIMRRPALPATSVVVGVDGSAGAAAAVRWAAAEACRLEVVLCIVSAWEDADSSGPARANDPGGIAAGRIQKALARVLSRPCFPRRIACFSPRGRPGPALLSQAGHAGLLVLGMTGIGAAPVPGRVNWYCLGHGCCPLIFVPAASGFHSPSNSVPAAHNRAHAGKSYRPTI